MSVSYLDFAQHCLWIYESPRYSEATLRKVSFVLTTLGKLGVHSTDQLTTDLFRSYVAARSADVCNNTIRGELTHLRACVNEAIDKEWVARAPKWRKLWPPRSTRRRKVLYSIDDLGTVLHHLESRSRSWDGLRLYALFVLVLYGGLRLREALLAEVEDLDLERRTIEVVARRRLKTADSARIVPIPAEAIPPLRRWIARVKSVHLFPNKSRSAPWTSGGPGRRPTERLRAAAAAVGVEGLTFQALRHCYVTWGRRRFGISGPAMTQIVGHTSANTHEENYLHPDEPNALADSVQGVRYRLTPDPDPRARAVC